MCTLGGWLAVWLDEMLKEWALPSVPHELLAIKWLIPRWEARVAEQSRLKVAEQETIANRPMVALEVGLKKLGNRSLVS